jgi:hypothetical protein
MFLVRFPVLGKVPGFHIFNLLGNWLGYWYQECLNILVPGRLLVNLASVIPYSKGILEHHLLPGTASQFKQTTLL